MGPLVQLVVQEILRFTAPVREAAEDGIDGIDRVLADAGLVDLSAVLDPAEAAGIAHDVRAAQQMLLSLASKAVADLTLADLSDAATATRSIRTALDRIAALGSTVQTNVVSAENALEASDFTPQAIARKLWDWLVWRRVSTLLPAVNALAELSGVIEPPAYDLGARVSVERLREFVRDPKARLAEAIGWGDALDVMTLFQHASRLIERAGIATEVLEGESGPELHLFLVAPNWSGATPSGTAGLVVSTNEVDGATELRVVPFGRLSAGHATALGTQTTLSIDNAMETGEPSGLVIARDGVSVANRPGAPAAGNSTIAVTRRAPDGERLELLPLGGLGAISASAISAGATARFGDEVNVQAFARVAGGRITVKPNNPDGFLAKLLPEEGIEAPFEVGATWSSDHSGIRFEGGAGLEVDLPVTVALLNAIRLETIHVSAALDGSEAKLEGRITGGVDLGPFKASVTRIGAAGSIAASRTSVSGVAVGDQGGLAIIVPPAEMVIRFAPPTGVGLGLDLGVVKGGGFLEIGENRYSGALQLAAGELAIGAFGVVETVLPDGKPGFSMLAFVNAEFATIQLGFGFTLHGLGGLIGLHRDVDIDALFAAVRAGTAGALLSPKDPVSEAPRLLRIAEGIFPPQRGQYVFGPTAKLGWGTPSLLTLDLALAVTLPEPLRIVLIGRLSGSIPAPEVPVIRINIDLAGVLDLTAGRFDMEGNLFDSAIQGIPVQGGFALRSGWKSDRSLIFSVGGLHPQFEPPANFPTLAAMGTTLSKGDWFKLGMTGYFAITSNMLQIGARVEVKVSKKGFTLLGALGFDALITFDPFSMQLDIYARVQVKRGSRSLFKIDFRGSLSGPNAWHIEGSATIEIPILPDVSVRASATFGNVRTLPSEPADVAAGLLLAIDNSANWTAERPGTMLVLAPSADGRCDPAGSAGFSQDVVPLGLRIDQFYGKRVDGARRFEITAIETVAGDTITLGKVRKRPFSPGSFFNLSEAERLKAPGFEDLPAGLTLDASDLRRKGLAALKNEGRTMSVVGAFGRTRRVDPPLPEIDLTDAPRPAPLVEVTDEAWTDAEPGGREVGKAGSYSETRRQASGGRTHMPVSETEREAA